MFLGVKAEVTEFSIEKEPPFTCKFNLLIPDNPLNDYVELPENLQLLNYSNIIIGVIKGAMASVIIFII